jgi:morphogenetic protein associated with SpoVID
VKIHMVKQGDTLFLLAKKYNVSLEDLIKANPEISNPDEITVGMKVKIPTHSKSALEVVHHHVVQQGDSLWKLSKAWGVQLADLIKANPQVKNPNALLTGEVINIPKSPHGAQASNMAMNNTPISGKANTGVLPSTGTKPSTGMKPETGIKPVQPMPSPPPVTITPVLPPVQPPAPVMPIAEVKPSYGYQMQEQFEFYGLQQPIVSPETTYAAGHSYGNNYENYGNVYGNSGYDQHDYSGYDTYNSSYHSPTAQGITSPLQMSTPSGCKSCGGASALPTYANTMAVGASPYQNPYPGMGYGNMQQMVSPAGGYVSGYPGMVAPAHGYGPQVQPYFGGFQPFPSFPSIPPMPPMPPMPSMPSLAGAAEPCDDRSSSSEDEPAVTTLSVKKRSVKPKTKPNVVRQNRPKRRDNLPWIKW